MGHKKPSDYQVKSTARSNARGKAHAEYLGAFEGFHTKEGYPSHGSEPGRRTKGSGSGSGAASLASEARKPAARAKKRATTRAKTSRAAAKKKKPLIKFGGASKEMK